jgi:hypothetical protein
MDYQIEEPRRSLFSELFRALSGEARRMGASRLVFWEPPGGPYRDFLMGPASAVSTPATVGDAGFSFATVAFEEEAAAEFAQNLHLIAGAYDDR